MATLVAVEFPTVEGADNALTTLAGLQKQQLITVHDAATVSWPEGAKRPKTRQAHNLAGAGAMGGMFWGMLFGMLFLMPFLGAAVGAGIGALSGSLSDYGIDDRFIEQVKQKVTPGTSALFTLTSDAVIDRVAEAFKGQSPTIISSNLSREQEAELREAFGGSEAAQS